MSQLALDPRLVESVREKIETSLLRAYTKGKMQARRAIEPATQSRDESHEGGAAMRKV